MLNIIPSVVLVLIDVKSKASSNLKVKHQYFQPISLKRHMFTPLAGFCSAAGDGGVSRHGRIAGITERKSGTLVLVIVSQKVLYWMYRHSLKAPELLHSFGFNRCLGGMMTNPIGPGSPYELLFVENHQEQASLPDPFREIYPGDWQLRRHETRPYIYTNFAMSRDGRISFNLPGQRAARFVTKSDPHDRWLMGLLRMRSDAVLIGDETIRAEPDYLSSAETIYPDDAAAFTHQRRREGRSARPLTVILSAEGRIPEDAQCLQCCEERVIIATTCRGVDRAKALAHACQLEVLELGEEWVDLHQLVHLLHAQLSDQDPAL